MQHELAILEEKTKRIDPPVANSIPACRLALVNDKKFKSRLKKNVRKTKYEDVTNIDFLEQVFEDKSKTPEFFLDLNYFSQYIPSIGFMFNIDLLFNFDPSMVYVAVCSINPPGSLYQENMSTDRMVVYSEVDFKSNVQAQRFNESFYMLKHLPMNQRSHLVVDVKAIKFSNSGPAHIRDYAWTAFPIFSSLDVDEDGDANEIFVRSGLHMMPMIKGPVRNDIIQQLAYCEDTWGFLNEKLDSKVEPISLLPNTGTVIQ